MYVYYIYSIYRLLYILCSKLYVFVQHFLLCSPNFSHFGGLASFSCHFHFHFNFCNAKIDFRFRWRCLTLNKTFTHTHTHTHSWTLSCCTLPAVEDLSKLESDMFAFSQEYRIYKNTDDALIHFGSP